MKTFTLAFVLLVGTAAWAQNSSTTTPTALSHEPLSLVQSTRVWSSIGRDRILALRVRSHLQVMGDQIRMGQKKLVTPFSWGQVTIATGIPFLHQDRLALYNSKLTDLRQEESAVRWYFGVRVDSPSDAKAKIEFLQKTEVSAVRTFQFLTLEKELLMQAIAKRLSPEDIRNWMVQESAIVEQNAELQRANTQDANRFGIKEIVTSEIDPEIVRLDLALTNSGTFHSERVRALNDLLARIQNQN